MYGLYVLLFFQKKITKNIKPSSWIAAHLFVPLTEKHFTSFTVILDDNNREPRVVLIRKKLHMANIYLYRKTNKESLLAGK